MSHEIKILVEDSSILFDLLDLNLIESFFTMDCRILTTPQVIAEVLNKEQLAELSIFIESDLLIVDSNGSFDIIKTLTLNHPGLSYADCSILELASRINGILLSSDKGLRNESKKRNILAKGMLWVMEEMVNNNIISKEIAVEKLRIYPQMNNRVPRREIDLVITRLENLIRSTI